MSSDTNSDNFRDKVPVEDPIGPLDVASRSQSRRSTNNSRFLHNDQFATTPFTKIPLEHVKDEDSLDPKTSLEGSSGGETTTPKVVSAAQKKMTWKERYLVAHPKLVPYVMAIEAYVLLFFFFMGILAIYWGSYYRREERLTNLEFLVVTESDDSYISTALTLAANMTDVARVGTWTFRSPSQLLADAPNNNTVAQEVARLVHKQKYWGAIWVRDNVTSLYEAFSNANASYIPTNLIEGVYESGRDYSAVGSYSLPSMRSFEAAFYDLCPTEVFGPLIRSLTQTSKENIIANNATQLLSFKPLWQYTDNRPASSPVVVGPSEIGLIYSVVISFHQFNFSMRIHTAVKTHLNGKHFVIFRMLSSQVTYVVLALVYCLTVIAFRVDYRITFGRSGFLALWGIMFLNISALGGLNELFGMCIFAADKTKIGFWVIFFIVINMCSVVSPMALCPAFYRFGYGLPLHNTFELLKVLFFNVEKSQMGRNLGILIAWIAIANALLPFAMKWSAKTSAINEAALQVKMMKVAQAKKALEAKKAAEKAASKEAKRVAN